MEVKRQTPQRREAGLTLIEAIIGALVTLIFASVVVHFARLGYAMYKLNSATTEIAQELEQARQMAVDKNQRVQVLFDMKSGHFGLDRNSNGRLDNAEGIELPSGVSI